MCAKRFIASLLLCLSLCSSSLFSETIAVNPSYAIYETELLRCRAISQRLKEISLELELQLSTSVERLETLRLELSQLQSELAELRTRLEYFETRSADLGRELTKAEDLVTSSKRSFEEYRIAAEMRITSVRNSFLIWRTAAVGLGGAALGAGIDGKSGALYVGLPALAAGVLWWVFE